MVEISLGGEFLVGLSWVRRAQFDLYPGVKGRRFLLGVPKFRQSG